MQSINVFLRNLTIVSRQTEIKHIIHFNFQAFSIDFFQMPLCLMYSHPPTHTNSLCHSHSLALTTTHPPIPILSHTPICMHTHTRTPMHTHVISRTQMLPVFKSSSGEPQHLTLDWSSLSRSLFHNLLIRPSEQNPDDGLNG